MPYYNLWLASENKMLSAAAGNIDDALSIFGAELGQTLTLDEGEHPSPYLLDEWHESPHWANPTIPVFVMSS